MDSRKNVIGNITHRPLDISIPTIPDKNRGDFKMVNALDIFLINYF